MAATRMRVEASVDAAQLGKYLLLDQVAQGRLSSVHRALVRRDGEPDERFAIKRFARELSGDRRFAERAARVLARASQIEHPAHCRIAEVDRADDCLYAALEWVAGRDLKRIAAALRERGAMMPVALVAYVGAQIAEVLAEAHGLARPPKIGPLLHGELSAADILIGYDGRVRLIGLGSAELAVAAQAETTRTAYQAPEIELGAPCSAQTDVFSLGACLLKVLSQKTVTDRADSHITQIVPRGLKLIIERAVAMQPEARWQSAAELAHQLQSWLATQTQPADAAALSAFMRGLFDDERSAEQAHEHAGTTTTSALRPKALAQEPARDEPWAEHTPANGVLMQQLAAEMSEPPPAPAREETGRSILDAIMNPSDDGEPEPISVAAPALPPAVEGWEDTPWEVDNATVRAPIVRVALDRPSAPVPAPAPVQARAPVPAPVATPARPVVAMPVAPAQPASSAFLHTWQSERRPIPWLAIGSIAAGALAVVLFFMLRSTLEAPAAIEAMPLESERAASPAPQAAVPEPSAIEQQEAAPSEAVVEVDPTPAQRIDEERATANTPRKRERERERRAAPAEPAERAEVIEEAPVRPEPPPQAPMPVAQAPVPAPVVPAPAAAAPPVVAVKPPPPRPSGPTRAAIALEKVAPAFPVRAKRMDITQGVVTVEYTVDKAGSVRDPRVVSAEPKSVFDEAALKAIQKFRYQPALSNGFPTESRARFTFRFE